MLDDQSDPHLLALRETLFARFQSAPAFELPNSLPAEAVPVLQRLLAHRSIRAYLPVALPEGSVELAIAAAQSASSSSNLQSWSVVLVDDAEQKARLNRISGTQSHIAQAPVLLVWLADLGKLRGVAAQAGSPGAGIDHIETLVMSVVDASLAAQNAVTAFEAQGLGACYIGGIRNHPEQVAEILGLPDEVLPVFGLTVGVPDPDRPAHVKPRLPQAAVLHRNRYDPQATARAVPAYDDVLGAFQKSEGVPVVGWSRAVAARLGTPEALNGRERLGEALRNLSFQLK